MTWLTIFMAQNTKRVFFFLRNLGHADFYSSKIVVSCVLKKESNIDKPVFSSAQKKSPSKIVFFWKIWKVAFVLSAQFLPDSYCRKRFWPMLKILNEASIVTENCSKTVVKLFKRYSETQKSFIWNDVFFSTFGEFTICMTTLCKVKQRIEKPTKQLTWIYFLTISKKNWQFSNLKMYNWIFFLFQKTKHFTVIESTPKPKRIFKR